MRCARIGSVKRRELLLAGEALALGLLGCEASPRPQARPGNPGGVRPVAQVVLAQRSKDGAGVKLSRALGGAALPELDPFLLLDEIRSTDKADYEKGFPRHPHRGFETVTYMIEGAMEHQDTLGNRGRLVGGAAQWMTAGHGIIHSEMPKQDEGLLWGFQLWVNLPQAQKLAKPRYQDIEPGRIPELSLGGNRVRLVAGAVGATRGPVEGIVVAPTMMDVAVAKGSVFEHEVEPGHNSFAYVIEGAVALGPEGTRVERGQLAVLGSGASVRATSDEGGRFLWLAGAPLLEPVARSGPFVMNTEAELEQAWSDYRSGRLLIDS